MHGIVEEWKKGNLKFTYGFDTGGSIGALSELDVEIDNGKGFESLCSRCFFFDEDNERHIFAFARKIEQDAVYRNQIKNQETNWQKIAEIYEAVAYELYKLSRSIPNSDGYRVGDKEQEKSYKETHEAIESGCKNIHKYITKNIESLWKDWKPTEIKNRLIQKIITDASR